MPRLLRVMLKMVAVLVGALLLSAIEIVFPLIIRRSGSVQANSFRQ
jgi:hypothetical protein